MLPHKSSAVVRFLQHFCDDNAANQNAVANNADSVPTALAHLDYELGADMFLIKLHEKNYQLTSVIDDNVVTAFLNIGLKSESDVTHLSFLKEVAVSAGLPIARNQTMIMNHLIDQQTERLQEGLHTNLAELTEFEQKKEAALVDLIADCCAGFNSSTESPAQGFLSLNGNLDILRNPGDVRLEYQIPYMKFLCEVWWLRESNNTVQDRSWFENENFWFVLDRFLGFLMDFNSDNIDTNNGSIEAHIMYIYEGIVPILTTYIQSALDSKVMHLLPFNLSASLRYIADELVTLTTNKVHVMFLGNVQLQALEECLKVMARGQIQRRDPLEEAARWCIDTAQRISQIHDDSVVQPGITRKTAVQEQSMRIGSGPSHVEKVRRCCSYLQGMVVKHYTESSTSAAGKAVLYDFMYDYMKTEESVPVIRKVVRHLEKSLTVPKHVQVGMLQMFTQMLTISQSEKPDEDRLCDMQIKMSDGKIFDTTTLIAALGEREDEVAWEAIDFGIELLDGGNPEAQNRLLLYFHGRKGDLFQNISRRIQLSSQVLPGMARADGGCPSPLPGPLYTAPAAPHGGVQHAALV